MEIRKALFSDLDHISEIYSKARDFMAKNGNPRQWCLSSYPPLELIKNDIQNENLYLCTLNSLPVGVFFFSFGVNVEPLYSSLCLNNSPYAVVHRIASNGSVRGVGRFCLSWAIENSGSLMIDTHPDNKVMQALLSSLGFAYVGDINIPNDPDIRMVYRFHS